MTSNVKCTWLVKAMQVSAQDAVYETRSDEADPIKPSLGDLRLENIGRWGSAPQKRGDCVKLALLAFRYPGITLCTTDGIFNVIQ
ncbi:hypothetical protein PGT21_024877 [Puccinia graminis f. sp. tritici]|nr:hypothetical protein PGT21_024877 [Puccinia graminis f. sp. tritici]